MVVYENFAFASVPRTGTTWFLKAAAIVGLGARQKTHAHMPPPENWQGFLVSTVRHPYDWLASYHLALNGGYTSCPMVDTFQPLATVERKTERFIARVLDSFEPGVVGRMFDSYRANSVLRVEDFPWAACELFSSVGVPSDALRRITKLPPQNGFPGIPHVVDIQLRKRVVASEHDMCSRFEYYA